MTEAELGVLSTINGAQLFAIIVLIMIIVGFILSKYPKIKEFVLNWYNRKKRNEEILNTILQNKKDISELKESDKEDKNSIVQLHEELTSSMNKVFEALEEVKRNQIRSDEKREEDNTIQARVRILRAADEIRIAGKDTSKYPSRESFRQTMSDIDKYEKYCSEHPEFVNNFTVSSINGIKNAFESLPNDHF